MYQDLFATLATEHQRDLRQQGGLARLAALAAACCPNRLRRAGTAVAARFSRAECGCTA